MKSCIVFVAMVVMTPLGAVETKVAVTLTVMSYNVRYANNNPGEAWMERRPLVRRVILAAAPDVLGTQEGVHGQLQDMAADLPGYDWIGRGREGGHRGEFCAVFYRRARLEALEFEHFWLSDRPEEAGSMTWGNTFPRMVTWVRFRTRADGREFYFVNTHFDHQSEPARRRSAEMPRERIGRFAAGVPVIVAGDFNAAAGASEPFRILTAGGFLADTHDLALERTGPAVGTFNNFKAAVPSGERIDWILMRGGLTVESVGIDARTEDGRFPSDHFPVIARLKWSSPPDGEISPASRR